MTCFWGCSEYDDSALKEEIEQLKQRVLALEQANANANIASLWEIVNQLQKNGSVVSVTPFEDATGSGYVISFAGDTPPVKLYNGKDGADAPVVGVRAIAGVYYWTLTVNGSTSYILDAAGNRIPTTGKDAVSPQLKIEDGFWMLSSDGGKTWTQIASVSDGLSNYFRSVLVMGDEVHITTADGTVIVLPLKTVERTGVFDADNIVLSLAAISDTHIGNNYGSETKFTRALQQLKAKAAEKDPNGLDAVMVVGDLVNNANQGQVESFKNLYEQVFDPVKVPMIYTIGNHDMNPGYSWTANTISQNKVLSNVFGENYFLTDQDQTMRQNFECRHCIVGSCHILCVTPYGTSPITYDANVTTWLDRQLKEITEADPSHYVLLLTHPMIYNTVYGSLLQDTYTNLGEYWSTKALSSILEKYPQVVTFGGHLHFPLNDPRSIWQGKFTAFGCASTSYMAIENGNYENMSSATVMKDAGEYSEGLLVQFDISGNMRATRMDFYREAEIGAPWTVPYPAADGSHLDRYNHLGLRAANTAPALSDATVNVGALSDNYAAVTLSFAAGTDDEFVHHYEISVKQGSSTVVSKRVLADFYRAPQPSQMKDSYSLSLGSLAKGSYSVQIIAVDSWDAESAPLVKDFSIGAADSGNIWVSDEAGSKAIEGGSGSVSDGWLSYSGGSLSWTANTSGTVREASLTLPSGSAVSVRQFGPAEFTGSWNMLTKVFAPNTSLGFSGSTDPANVTLTISAAAGSTANDGASSITNNLRVAGLVNGYVAEAVADIDYKAKSCRFGLFFNGNKAQAVNTGKSGYGYLVMLPELGNGWTSYNFAPVPFNGGTNYGWLWFVVDDMDKMHYGIKDWYKMDGKDVLGISFCAVSKENPSGASDYAQAVNTTKYDVIHQCNAKGSNTDTNDLRFVITRK